MALHARDDRTLERAVATLRELHGGDLAAVVLTGEAATSDYRPRRSPLTVAVVLEEITTDALRKTRAQVRRWRRRRIPTPLVLDRTYIETALDVFPLEFLDLCDRHRVLWGDDPFEGLRIDSLHLRIEVEEQIRGKLLHLWEGYLVSHGSARVLRRLLLETPSDFQLTLRGMLRLHHDERPADAATLVATVESSLGLELPTFRRLENVRGRAERLRRGELEQVFDSYLGEVRRLVRVVDQL